ncbi:MAG TPA: Arc family DNA-binding protein [Bradyrhizobium sp.]|nr:Arc family DNA-binding protein [Bradyrhizobium sp.]
MAQRGRPPGPERVAFPLRAEKAILEAVKRCAVADLRSVNAEIEMLLREALARRGVRIKPTNEGGDP